MPPFPDFAAVFAALRGIRQRRQGKLTVTADSPTRYRLEGASHPAHKKPMPIAGVQIGKGDVSFHPMGVYASPALLKIASKELRARMQGKSCFRFQPQPRTA